MSSAGKDVISSQGWPGGVMGVVIQKKVHTILHTHAFKKGLNLL
jgi:hypothetical protein